MFADAAKLTSKQVQATRLGQLDCWTAGELNLLSVVDQLCASGVLDSRTLAEFQSNWSREQQLEIMALVGTYSTISFVANVAMLPCEPFAANFPAKH